MCSNYGEVCGYSDPTGTAYYSPATSSIKVLDFDPENFWVSALHITAQYIQVKLSPEFLN